MLIRRESTRDTGVIHAITAAAFARPGQPPGQTPLEARLVDELRADPAWLPHLSLVAATPAGEVVGHVLCTRGHVGQAPVLALGPLAVRPDSQRRGVGSALMHAVLGAADALDEPLVALLGSPAYYSRFGFRSRRRIPDRATQAGMAAAFPGSCPTATGRLALRLVRPGGALGRAAPRQAAFPARYGD